ncbi:MAG TPA: thiazole synthase [Firmicutes bacterium]|nr:thiazole synthase [Bacillota bacterium]
MEHATDNPLVIGGREFGSRLLMGTGKFADSDVMVRAWEAGGTECVTVAIRRIELGPERKEKNFIDYLDPGKHQLLPNTAGCFSVEDVLRTARLAREATGSDWIKVEVLGDEKTLLPDVAGTIEATKILKDEGFTVLPYTSQDPIVARKLFEAGADAIMPLASPIGSGQGFPDFSGLQFIIEEFSGKVPIVVDAGIGAPSDASLAMELGADACLINTAIALSSDPPLMAAAMAQGIEAGRKAFLAGRIPRRRYASASTTMEGRIGA